MATDSVTDEELETIDDLYRTIVGQIKSGAKSPELFRLQLEEIAGIEGADTLGATVHSPHNVHVIDCDAPPPMPVEGEIEEHHKLGLIEFDPAKFSFYLHEAQQAEGLMVGHDLRQKLKGRPVMNACMLDYLFHHASIIPDSWKWDELGNTRYIYFWGTIFRSPDDILFVWFLSWREKGWGLGSRFLSSEWGQNDPAIISVG